MRGWCGPAGPLAKQLVQSLRMHSQKGFSFRDLSELWLRVKQTDDCLTLSLFDDWQRAHAARAAASEEPSREREKARITIVPRIRGPGTLALCHRGG